MSFCANMTFSSALLNIPLLSINTVQYSVSAPLNMPLLSINTVQCSAAQRSSAQLSSAQHSTAQHSTAQHSTAQYSTAQHSTAQHSTIQYNTCRLFCKGHLTERVSWFCFSFLVEAAQPINFSMIPFDLVNLRETEDFIKTIKV